jgi:chitodextrinase
MPSFPHRPKHSNSRRRNFFALPALLVGAVTCIASAAGAAQLRDASPMRDLASQARLARADRKPHDISPPTMPKRLRLATATPTSVTLSWSRSNDNVEVAGYEVFVGQLTIRTRETTHTTGSLECSTTYRAGVTAFDAVGNRSRTAWISVATAACAPPQPPTDTQPPSRPILSLGPAAQTTLELRWQASTDNVGVHHYNVFRGKSATAGDQLKIAETTALSYVYTQLTCGTSYSLALQAQDAAGNKSNLSEAIWYPVTTRACDQPPPPPPPPPADTQPPSAPSNLLVTSSTATSIALVWTASTDNVGVAGYDVYLNGVKVWMPSGTSFTYLGLSCATTYTAAVDAYDAAGNHSPKTAVTVATPACPDTTPPSTPTGLAASSVTQTSLTLGWKASSDNVGVKGYDVYRNGTKVATVSGTSSSQSGLACDTQYAFAVAALDAAGNASTTAQLNAGTSACTAPASPINPPPPSGAGFLFDQKSDLVPGFFNGTRATEISTVHGPGFNFQSPGANQGAECPWDLGLACVIGKWIYPADFMGKTYDWTFYVRFPSAGNPQGFPSNWLTNAFFEVGHTNVSSGHHIALDMVWAQRGSLRWRLGIATNEPTNTWDYSSPGAVVQMDTWYKWRMQIKWSLGADGFINVWLNDQLVKEYDGHTAPNGAAPALQAGIYSIDDRPLQDQIADLRYVRTP